MPEIQWFHYILCKNATDDGAIFDSIANLSGPKRVTMGIGFRVFLINDDDSLQRLSVGHYGRLLHGEPKEQLPQYAGKRVRCAAVSLEVKKRKPQSIIRIDYDFLFFDAEGRIEKSEQEKEIRLAAELMSPLSGIFEKESSRKIVDARSQFAKKRYEQEFKWSPSPEIEGAIMTAIFGPDYF